MANLLPKIDCPLSKRETIDLNPNVLAFVGDGVQTLYERTRAALVTGKKTHELHRVVASGINATAQSEAYKRIAEFLTEEETAVYKRARNTKTNTSAKNADIIDYRIATGYESVVGYLYLTGETARLDFVLNAAYQRELCFSEPLKPANSTENSSDNDKQTSLSLLEKN